MNPTTERALTRAEVAVLGGQTFIGNSVRDAGENDAGYATLKKQTPGPKVAVRPKYPPSVVSH